MLDIKEMDIIQLKQLRDVVYGVIEMYNKELQTYAIMCHDNTFQYTDKKTNDKFARKAKLSDLLYELDTKIENKIFEDYIENDKENNS